MSEGSCKSVVDCIDAYLDGALTERRRSAVARHLRGCPGCRRVLHQAEGVRRALDLVAKVEPRSEHLWAGIEARLNAPERADAGVVSRRGSWSFRAASRAARHGGSWKLAAAAASVVLSLGVLWIAAHRQAIPGVPTEPSATTADGGAASSGSASRPARRNERGTPPPMALEIGSFVRERTAASADAAGSFWSRYAAVPVDLSRPGEEIPGLHFRPILTRRLPEGLRLVEARLLHDACCETLQLRYRAGERWVDVFQFHGDHPVALGDVLAEPVELDGAPCTSLTWRDAGAIGRRFRRGDVQVVLVGDMEAAVADRLAVELLRAAG